MKLVASMIVRDEAERYLGPCVEHLLDFCDEVRILDDNSAETTQERLRQIETDDERVLVRFSPADQPEMFRHEGRARNLLLDWTMEGDPTHVLAIDADEFVANADLLRPILEDNARADAFALDIAEVWKADGESYMTREDGGWRTHPIMPLWRCPEPRLRRGGQWKIANRPLACGRVPVAVGRTRRVVQTGATLLHLGWACEAEREARHSRYTEHDGGRFHQSTHLDSILLSDSQITLSAPKLWNDTEIAAFLVEQIIARVESGPVSIEQTSVTYDREADVLWVSFWHPAKKVVDQKRILTLDDAVEIGWTADGEVAWVMIPDFGEDWGKLARSMPLLEDAS